MSLNLLPRFPIDRWPLIPLRLIVGYGFLEHGFAKLAKGPDAFANILQAIGVPGPHFKAWSTILVEILGGLAVILGAFVALASVPMAAVLLVAMFTVHLPYGFSSIKLTAITAAGGSASPGGSAAGGGTGARMGARAAMLWRNSSGNVSSSASPTPSARANARPWHPPSPGPARALSVDCWQCARPQRA